MIKLIFKATENYKTHYDLDTGFVRDGDVVNVGDKVAKQLLQDYPENFFKTGKSTVEGAKMKVVDDRNETAFKAAVFGSTDAKKEDVETTGTAEKKKKRGKKRGGK